MQIVYFVIDEKINSVDLTEKGVELITSNWGGPSFLYYSRRWFGNSRN
jgi:hypothetical protein